MPIAFTRQDADRQWLENKLKARQKYQHGVNQEIAELQRKLQVLFDRREAWAKEELILAQQILEIKPSTVRRLPSVEHTWTNPHADKPCDTYGCQWCDVGLEFCSACGAFEGACTTHCAGVQVNMEIWDRVYAGELDYRFGRWIERASRCSPAWIRNVLDKRRENATK